MFKYFDDSFSAEEKAVLEYFDSFSAEAKEVTSVAIKEAQSENSNVLRNEHVLLALTSVRGIPVNGLLEKHGITTQDVRRQLERSNLDEPASEVMQFQLASSLKGTIILAEISANHYGRRGHFIELEHLLLGIIREKNNAGAQVLSQLGFEEQMIRQYLQNAREARWWAPE